MERRRAHLRAVLYLEKRGNGWWPAGRNTVQIREDGEHLGGEEVLELISSLCFNFLLAHRLGSSWFQVGNDIM